jgi:hypothetical protein
MFMKCQQAPLIGMNTHLSFFYQSACSPDVCKLHTYSVHVYQPISIIHMTMHRKVQSIYAISCISVNHLSLSQQRAGYQLVY